MPRTSSETFYDLAIRALEEQEREVSGLRTRTGTLVAAAAVAATLLVRFVFAGSHPDGWLEWSATGVGLAALAVVLLASVYLLRSHDLSFGIDAAASHMELEALGTLESDDATEAHLHLTYTLSSIRAENGLTVKHLKTAFACALGGLLVETLGLGLGAALA